MRTIFFRARGSGAIAVAFMATGCATTFPDYPVHPAASYKHHLEQNGVIVAIQPLTKASEQRKYFDTNLASRDILPVFVVVENHNPFDTKAQLRQIIVESNAPASRSVPPVVFRA